MIGTGGFGGTDARIRPHLAVFLALLLTACGEDAATDDETTGSERGTPVAAVEIQPRDLSRELSVSASVEAKTRIRLAARTSGTIDTVLFDVGDRVEQGDVMVRLDLSEQRAEMRRAAAEAEDARLEYERARTLRERNAISRAEYENARVARDVAQSVHQLWQARLDFGEIAAPRSAIVSARHVEPGEGVQAQDELFELTVMDTLVIRPGISELDVVHLEPGQSVPVRLDAMPETVFEATLRRIHPTASTGSRLITVEVEMPDGAAEQGVRPGYLARIRMPIDTRADTIAVPAGAVGEDGDQRYVYVIVDETLERREIETGVTRAQWTEVRSGLEAGEIVLATNPIDMREGERVRIVGWRG